MSTDGILEYQGTKRVLFRGDTSNIVFDTRTTSLGIGVTGSNNPSSNLYITGNAYVSSNLEIGGVMTMGVVNVAARHNLQAVTAIGNVTTQTVQFDNPTTAFTTTGNVSDLNIVSNVNMLHTANTAAIKLNSNVVTEFPRSKKLIKYPRVALTQNALNNGYAAEASSQESTNRQAWKVFNNTYAEGDGWRSWGQTYSSSDGSFTGTFVDFSNGGQTFTAADQGQWVKITLPEKMRLERFRLQPRYSPTTGGATYSYGRSEFVKNGAIWGSNNGSSWDKVYTITHGVPATDTTITEFTVLNSTTAYNNFVLVVTDTHGSSAGLRASFSEWELLGVPEYDPDAHGTDVVVKSVPNVPNTEWLDVFVDAGNTSGYSLSGSSVNSVTDLSSPANTMSVTGVTYDSTNKAFVFSGSSSSYIKATLANGNGNYAHTLSVWFMMTDYSGSWRSIMGVGSNGTGTQSSIAYDPDQDQLYYGLYGADIYVPHKPELGRWYHVAATFTGGEASSATMNLYLNGVNMGGAPNGTLTPSFTGDQLCIGGTMNSNGTQANNPFKGQIANARFYRRAYTSDELYQLYAYQKEYFGHSTNNLTLKAGRLGIGTSEPRAVLDVRGDIYGGCPVFFRVRKTTDTFGGTDPIIWNEAMVNKGGGYDTNTGKFTAPVSGYYEFIYGGVSGRSDWSAEMFAKKNDVKIDGSGAYAAGGGSHWARALVNTVILELNQGDVFHLYLVSGNQDMYGGSTYSYNFFSGKYLSN